MLVNCTEIIRNLILFYKQVYNAMGFYSGEALLRKVTLVSLTEIVSRPIYVGSSFFWDCG